MRSSADQRHRSHRDIWSSKPVLREVYGDLYRRVASNCVSGMTVEVGGGSGNFKEFRPDVVSLDVVPAPWLDLVADAQFLPFRDGSIRNLVMLDVLHHIEFPLRFFREAARVLSPGGRVVAIEPGLSPISRPFYSLLHEEPVDLSVDPLGEGVPSAGKDPYEGNQAVPTLLATRERLRLAELVPDLSLVRTEWMSLFAYPLSGGFKRWSLLSSAAARVILHIEDRLPNAVRRICGFRLLLAWQRA